MRILIPGGSGLIGRELTTLYCRDGDEVTILSRYPEAVKGLPVGARVVKWDGKTMSGWEKEIPSTDAVVNLTGENISGEGFFPTRWTKRQKENIRTSRIEAGNVLTEAIKLADEKSRVFVQASGVNFYGTQSSAHRTETEPAGKDYFANLCIDWEASSAEVEAMGLRRIIIRSGVVLSTESGALPRLLLPYRIFVGGPLGTGRQIYSWIHIRDEVEAIRFLIQNSQASGVFNLTAPYPVSNNEFGKGIAEVLKRPHYFPIPGFMMKLAFGEVASVVLEGIYVKSQKLVEAGFVFQFPVLRQALADLLT